MLGFRRAAAALLAAASLSLGACLSPQASLLLALIPDGTFTMLLSKMQSVDATNRERLAQYAQKNDWQGVVDFSRENIAKDPTNPDWWLMEGYAHSQLRQFPQANAAFQEVVRLTPDDIDGWNLLAQSYRAIGQPERAIRTLQEALRVNSDSPLTYYFMAESFSDLKRYDRAVEWYQQSLQRAPKFAEAWYGLAVANARLGRRADFEDAVQTLRTINPQLASQLTAAPASAATPR